MRVLYKFHYYDMDFPDDSKFFKLTRKYYPDLKFRIGEQDIEIKDLKFKSEVRMGEFNSHHIILPRSRGGENIESNLLKMDISRHNAWHLLFGNMTLYEIIQLLIKILIIKEKQYDYGRECQQKITGVWLLPNQKGKKHRGMDRHTRCLRCGYEPE